MRSRVITPNVVSVQVAAGFDLMYRRGLNKVTSRIHVVS